jgi:hypothetical protein
VGAGARVFGAFALAAGVEVEVDAEILGFGVGGGAELDDDAVGFG